MVHWLKQCLAGNPSPRSKFLLAAMAMMLLAHPILADSDIRALHDGVVVAPEQGLLYMMTPAGGIEGVNLETGEVSWYTEEAAKPLALAGDLLIAQAEPETKGLLPIVSLDTRKAGAAEQVMRVRLPKGVRALIDDGLGKSFRAWADADGAKASVMWKSSSQLPSGASPEIVDPSVAPVVDASSAKAAPAQRFSTMVRHEGAFQLDLASGSMQETTANKALDMTRYPLRELSADKSVSTADGRQFLSIDGRHVLVSERQTDGGIQNRYQWTIFDRASGEQLGQMTNRVSAAPFLVSGKGLIYVSHPASYLQDGQWTDKALALRSIDLLSGTERWSRQLRDTQYTGPFPQ